MPELADFQLAFASSLRRRGAPRPGSLEAQPGFAVYRNTTPNALLEALGAAYPVARQILGEAAFDELALDFARTSPPRDPVLAGYGGGFADFLAGQPWIGELPYLADVARIERMRTEAHIAADARALSLTDLGALGADGWMTLRLPLHPATRFLWMRVPALTIWKAHVDGFDRLEPAWQAEGALVTRPISEVVVGPIGAPAHRLLFGLRLGESVGEAAAAVAKLYPESDFPALFAELVTSGAFAVPTRLERNA